VIAQSRLGGPALLLVLVVGLAAACTGTTSPTTPAAVATAEGPDAPTAKPTSTGTAGPSSPIHVALNQATAKVVTIDVTDGSGTMLVATSGTPGDGASVEPYKLVVANDNPTTLRLTWVGGPCDSANSLSIDPTRRQFLLVQPECSGDSIVSDRILVITFSQPIVAADIQASIQDGLDT
jgi:hypothetical protein